MADFFSLNVVLACSLLSLQQKKSKRAIFDAGVDQLIESILDTMCTSNGNLVLVDFYFSKARSNKNSS